MVNMHAHAGPYEVKDNGVGCGHRSLDQDGCAEAITTLKYAGVLETGNWSHAPYGCFVGHPYDNWQYAYFNSQHGQTGRDIYKSICLACTYFILIIENLHYMKVYIIILNFDCC